MPSPSRMKPALTGALSVLLLGCLAAPAGAALPQQSGTVDLANAKPNSSIDGVASSDQAGTAVASAGDVNGDGLADVIVGAPNADPNARRDAGTVYVVFGRGDGASVDLGKIVSSGLGFRIEGAVTTDRLGGAVSRAGDMNGDGLGDVIVGAREADNRGRSGSGSAYVIFGRTSSGAVDTANLGSNGFRIDGATSGERAASWVSGGRDVNADGRPDVMLGSPLADRNVRTNSGTVWVVFGKADSSGVDTAALGSAGYAIDGAAAGDQLSTVAVTRDVSGDGRSDVFAGARFADAAGRVDSGAAYLVAGKADGSAVDLAAGGSSIQTLHGAAAADNAGAALAQGGDLDGNGRGDLLLGAPGADNNGRSASGSAYVLLSPESGGTRDLASGGGDVWRIDGAAANDAAGTAVDAAGDLNADGRDDLVVGAPLTDRAPRTDTGTAHVLHGGGFSGNVDLASSGAAGFRAIGAGSSDQAGTPPPSSATSTATAAATSWRASRAPTGSAAGTTARPRCSGAGARRTSATPSRSRRP